MCVCVHTCICTYLNSIDTYMYLKVDFSPFYSPFSISPSAHSTLTVCLRLVNIHNLFTEFLSSSIFFDHSILIDYFVSPETSTTFGQFLSEYLSLAATDWTALVRACKELDDRNSEIIQTDSNRSDRKFIEIHKDQERQHLNDSPNLSQEGMTTKYPELALDSVLPSCSKLESRCEETVTADSDSSKPVSISKEEDHTVYADEDIPPSSNVEQTLGPAKRFKLDPDCGLPDEHDTSTVTSVPSATYHGPQRVLSVDQKDQQEIQNDNIADVSKESSDSEASEELESSGSVYSIMETSLDKMMDCLTQFKYALQRLKSSQLLVTVDKSGSISGSILDSFEQLEDLYEAMEPCL